MKNSIYSEIRAAGTEPPAWVQLLPIGPNITGFDGRSWRLPDPQAVVAAFQTRNNHLVVDWEHSSEHRAPQGLDAPAAGWIDALENRNGAIWGHVEWTPKAAAQIAGKEYRFLSPVFAYRKDDNTIQTLLSVGLTNQPNLNMTALNNTALNQAAFYRDAAMVAEFGDYEIYSAYCRCRASNGHIASRF